MQVDHTIAMSAGRDAGNRNAAANSRAAWNEDDWNAATAVAERLMKLAH